MAISDVREMCEVIKYNLESVHNTHDLEAMKDEIIELLEVLSAKLTSTKI